jgi:hypothetical protein
MKKFLPVLILLVWACGNQDNDENRDYVDIKLDILQNVITTSDNGLLVAGVNNTKITITKTNANFKTTWRNDNYTWGTLKFTAGWGGSFYSPEVKALFQENDQTVCAVNISQGGDVVWFTALLVTLDPTGTETGQIELKDFLITSAVQTPDHGIVLLGNNLIKCNENLQKLWEKEVTPESYRNAKIINTTDGGFAITGTSSHELVFLEKLDGNGNVQWIKKDYNPLSFIDAGYDLIQLQDDGFCIAGRTNNTSALSDLNYFLIRTDQSGDTVWTRNVGTTKDEWVSNIIYSRFNSILVQGIEGFPNDPDQKSTLIEFDLNGKIIHSEYVPLSYVFLMQPSGLLLRSEIPYPGYVRFTKVYFLDL